MSPRKILGLFGHAFGDFWKDNCPSNAAALSYSTVFSLPPLLMLVITISGLVWDPREIQTEIETQMGSLVGPRAALQVREMIASGQSPGFDNALGAVVGVLAIIVGATGAFIQLQSALNNAWHVEPDPKKGGIKNFVAKRVFSFGLILAVAFMLLVSLALTTALSALVGRLGLMTPVAFAIDFIVSFALITSVFAAMYRVLPDAKVAARDAWIGAVVTTILFLIGKFALGFYLGRSDPGSAYGAAGSLALILVWIYYAAMIVLFGAEFTEAWASEQGAGITPIRGATRVVEEKKSVEGGRAEVIERKAPGVPAEERTDEKDPPIDSRKERR